MILRPSKPHTSDQSAFATVRPAGHVQRDSQAGGANTPMPYPLMLGEVHIKVISGFQALCQAMAGDGARTATERSLQISGQTR
ncbi:hypothetical protein PoB_002872100 [Plakobranchus ocellatus]|uniref:Uncharacterized protein n=1 Tax=Plakobranchus ocellatus TaxID=259542 RepID=A0AAV3ZT85_9GAST|nr:hypothetical protein PoB_002872100 [Plakobranchus ocellatus]